MGAKPQRRNTILILLILFLDLLGFTLIFPLVPGLLDHYLDGARDGVAIDAWLGALEPHLTALLPGDRRDPQTLIILMGGLLGSVYSVLQFIAAPYWGKVSDRVGRRPILLITSLGLALSYVAWFFATSFTVFVLSRILGGIMAGNMSVASAAMADSSDTQNRTRAMGMVGAAFGMGFLIGPAIGGLSYHFGPEAVNTAWLIQPYAFPALVAFALALVSAICNILWLEETLDPEHRRRHPWIQHPFRRLRTELTGNAYRHVVMINLIYMIAFSAFEFTFSFFYDLEFGLDGLEIGLVFLYLGGLIVIGQGGIVRRLSGRIKSRKILLIGLAMMPIPMYLFAITPPSIGLSLLALAPIALGSSLILPAAAGLASLHTPEDRQGLAMGVLRSTSALGRAIGPLIGAFLYWQLGAPMAYGIIGITVAFIFFFALRLESEH